MRIILPNKKQSKTVTEINEKLKEEIEGIEKMLEKNDFLNGRKGYAVAHCQVSTEPQRLFVCQPGLMPHTVVINPKIIEKTEPFTAKEGCLSFPFRPFTSVKRYRKIKVEYQDRFLNNHTKEFEGIPSQIFQHEIQHFNGQNIYLKW